MSTSGDFDANSTKEITVDSQSSAPSVAVTLGKAELPFLQFGIIIYMRVRSSNGFTESNYSAVNVTLLVGTCRGINADEIIVYRFILLGIVVFCNQRRLALTA